MFHHVEECRSQSRWHRKIFLWPLAAVVIVGLSTALAADDRGDRIGAIMAAGKSIEPLHTLKGSPRPDDWLATRHEPRQSFDDYRLSDPNRPGRGRNILYIQTIGPFPEDRQPLIAETADFLGRFYGLTVEELKPIELSEVPAKARRKHSGLGNDQLDSLFLLDLLRPRIPDDGLAILSLTASDLWPNEPGRRWNFVFGQASLRDRVGVWSVCRLGDPRSEPNLLRLRTLKVAVHETGHLLGIQHCVDYECGMNGSNHLQESDRHPLGFCPECEKKVWWACRVDPVQRYIQLAAFATARGFDADARRWRDAAHRLGLITDQKVQDPAKKIDRCHFTPG